MLSTENWNLISAKTYSGCYGGETVNVGDSIIVKIKCPTYPVSMSRKQIIFVVDESGSMENTIIAVKASLFAARNSLLRLMDKNLAVLDENVKDQIFTEKCNVSLITFSDEAYCKWESIAACVAMKKSTSLDSFSTAVNNIQASYSTNMGAALNMAFAKKIPEYATWIILLTDGIANKGPCQTVRAFEQLVRNIPNHTKIIPLGYTTQFDPDTLSALGNMTYLDSEESIAEIFGSIMAEIATCYGTDAKILLPELVPQSVNPNEIIVVPDTMEVKKSRDIIGNRNVGCLYNEREYMYGHLPWGNTLDLSIYQYHGLKGNISYYDIERKTTVEIPFIIENGGMNIPDDIFEGYFESSKARIILNIYHIKKKRGAFNESYINGIKKKLDDWKHPTAISHKEEILRILNEKNNDKDSYISAVGIATNAQNQSNYTRVGRHVTTTQRITSSEAAEDYATYSTSIPISSSITIDLSSINH